MPAVAERKLSLEDFHARYDGEKPYFEYWEGEAVQKSAPDLLHSVVQGILVRLLDALGFDAGLEITLKLVPDYEPIPDVIAEEGQIGDPYPTEPFEIVIEILSPEDPFSRVLRECHLYETWGIRQVVVVDPQARVVWRFKNGSSRQANTIVRRGERVVTAQELWSEVNRRLRPAPVAERKLSLEDFHARYDGEKPYFEYWEGEAVQKEHAHAITFPGPGNSCQAPPSPWLRPGPRDLAQAGSRL